MTTEGARDGIMTATDMDQLTTPTEPAGLAPEPPVLAPEPPGLAPEAAPYTPPVETPRQLRTPTAWGPAFQSRERRWWTVALAATLLIAATGIGLLYVDDTNNQASVRSLTTQNESLRGRNQILQDELNTSQANLTATLGQLATTKAELEHPTLLIWNVPQTIKGANSWLVGGVPDTFTYHLQATSTGPMSVSILSVDDYAAAVKCMDAGSTANYCMNYSGAEVGFLNKTSVNYDFHKAEGCAAYVSVFTSASTVTVHPNISVTYAPASKPTGVCAA
jgi:hypothetical protein